MSGERKIWYSRCFTGYKLGNKLGVNAKYRGHDWEPPTHDVPLNPPEVQVEYEKHVAGYRVDPALMPEALYAFDPKRFNRVVDLFYAGCFKAVKGETAAALKHADWGGGGLVPVPIYEADKTTLRDENAHIMNFDKPIDCFVPERSSGLKEITNWKGTKYSVPPWEESPQIAISGEAVTHTPDMWFAPSLRIIPLFSDRFVSLVTDKRTRKAFDFKECVVV